MRPSFTSDPIREARGIVHGIMISTAILLGVFAIGYFATAALMSGHAESKRILASGQERFIAEPRSVVTAWRGL